MSRKSLSGFCTKMLSLRNLLPFLNSTCRRIRILHLINLFLQNLFDNIWKPQRLLKKFSCHDIEDNWHMWFKNYLEDRKERVGIHSLFSPQKDIMTRVIQDPVLGPLLYSLFRDDLKNRNYWRDNVCRWLSNMQGRQMWSIMWRITEKSHHA